MHVTAILPLPAGDRRRLFTPLAGIPPVVRAASALTAPAPDGVVVRTVVAAAGELVDEARRALAGHGLDAAVTVIDAGAGATRARCLTAALDDGAHTHVLVHDVRRPLAGTAVRDRVLAVLRDGATVALPALPFTDSAKQTDADGVVRRTVDRARLRTVQSPRGFTRAELGRLLTAADADFDELTAALTAGAAVVFVDGDADAFAVELPADAPLVEAVLAARNPRADRG